MSAAVTASFGVTAAISYATDATLPALPLLSLGLLLPMPSSAVPPEGTRVTRSGERNYAVLTDRRQTDG